VYYANYLDVYHLDALNAEVLVVTVHVVAPDVVLVVTVHVVAHGDAVLVAIIS
jgi:hypothetical protein